MKNKNELDRIFDKFNLSTIDREYLMKIINPIYSHQEFQKRMTNEFLHHSDITLGEHIIDDSILTYLLSNKYLIKNKNKVFRLDLAIKIAMLHDLYTIPWQNNKKSSVKHFFNKHGFRHPIEAIINSIVWYPELFINKQDAEIIIDGVIHHMFPLPVRVINKDKILELELKNSDIFNSLDVLYQNMIINSLKRKRLGILSFSKSKYKEGRIMSKADKIISIKQIKNLSSFKALLTGHNKSIKK